MSQLFSVPLPQIRPTQMAVGGREVANKYDALAALDAAGLERYLRAHSVPVIAGPGQYWYALDRHHLGCAAERLGVSAMFCEVHAAVEWDRVESFWEKLFAQGWCYPYDQHGQRRDFRAIPERFQEMGDDPYRSLAGVVRHRGGYAKTTTPFSEFRWADYFRHVVPLEVVIGDFERAVQMAITAAGSQGASGLPGFIARQGGAL